MSQTRTAATQRAVTVTQGSAQAPAPGTAARARRMGRLDLSAVAARASATERTRPALTAPAPSAWRERVAGTPALPSRGYAPYESARPSEQRDPDVWLIALPSAAGAYQSLEGAGRSGAIRVSRPYGHLRAVRPVSLDPVYAPPEPLAKKTLRRTASAASGGSLGSSVAGPATMLPATRPAPAMVSGVEVETDAGLFRVERRGHLLTHSDMAWALAHLETGEPESMVTLPRRQLALLLTLLPTAENPEQPEQDARWGWAHKLRGPWERGPLHTRGRLGRLIAFDADVSGRGMHRACFELLGAEDVVWAVGVPCFLTGSVYELVPLGKGLHPSRWLNWPLAKGRKRVGDADRPAWEIARVVYRVGAPRWPLAGVVEPLGPMGVAG